MPRLNLTPLLDTYHIRSKQAEIIPFRANWAQRQLVKAVEADYAEGRPSRFVILKARQIGVSTAIQLIEFSCCIALKNSNCVVVAHRADSSEHLFGISKLNYETWEYGDFFPARYSTRRELVFDGQGSSIRVMTADKPDVGRGRTISYLHASELAFWRLPVETMIGFAQSIPDLPGTGIFVESTANGVGNYFEELWDEAKTASSTYTPFFFPWFKHHEYLPCFGIYCENGTCKMCMNRSKGLKPQNEEEKRLLRLGASPAHVAWRRDALPSKFNGDESFFNQEMPSTPEDAFISSGVNAFSPDLLKEVFKPVEPWRGKLVRNASGNIEFVKDAHGPLRVFKPPSTNQEFGSYFIGADPCQPPGTLVRKVTRGNRSAGPILFEDVPIERIVAGDRVVSLKMQAPSAVYRPGRLVTQVKERDYVGPLVRVTTANHRVSEYTAEHRCVVRLDGPLAEGNYIVYLQRRGDDFRIGRTVWRRGGVARTVGLHRRAFRQGADEAWILAVHSTEEDAALDEAVLSVQFGVPTWQFQVEEGSHNKLTMPLERFWAKVGGNRAQAVQCLRACGRDIRFPFWKRETWTGIQDTVLVRAINLLSGMKVLEPDEIEPGKAGYLKARRGCGGWSAVEVTRSWYEGLVYSLEVDVDHNYVADGIVTHNCNGTSSGDWAAAQVINRHTKEQVAVWHGRINPVPFAEELARLGTYYNYAMVAPDIMGGGAATLGSLTHLYHNIWQHKNPDKWPGQERSRSLGFLGSWNRKQWMIAKLADYVERQQILIHDVPTYREMRAYVYYGSKGWGDVYGPATRDGYDDLVCALAIACLCESTEDPPPKFQVAPSPDEKGIVYGKMVDMSVDPDFEPWEEAQ